MTIKEKLQKIYKQLYEDESARYIGYNVAKGSRMYGTLAGLPMEALIETPCAENLMVGMAIGISLEGKLLPVVCFERHEFVLFALGNLAVMGDKFMRVTGEKCQLVVRCIQGGSQPLDPGAQHKIDYSVALEAACSQACVIHQSVLTYDMLIEALDVSPSGIVLIMEERDGYEQTVG